MGGRRWRRGEKFEVNIFADVIGVAKKNDADETDTAVFDGLAGPEGDFGEVDGRWSH